MKRSRYEEQRKQEMRRQAGSQGAASEVRKIDTASVDTKALVDRLDEQRKRMSQRKARYPFNRLFEP